MDKLEEWEKRRIIASMYLAFVVMVLLILVWHGKISSQVYSFTIGLIIGAVLANLARK